MWVIPGVVIGAIVILGGGAIRSYLAERERRRQAELSERIAAATVEGASRRT